MIRFEDVGRKVRAYSPRCGRGALAPRLTSFPRSNTAARSAHSGEPYLIHPLAVADFLADMKLDAVAIAAGLLHDVVEDTLTTIERIQELFGPEGRARSRRGGRRSA
jgi:GTP pyrophosphokinase